MGKPKVHDVSDSSDSDFDDEDPDSIEVPGGGKDLHTLSRIGSSQPSVPAAQTNTTVADDGLLFPTPPVQTRPPAPRQPGYEVIRIAPGTSPFGVVRQPGVVMQQLGVVRGQVPPGAIRLPMAAVQSLLKNNTVQIKVRNNWLSLTEQSF